MAMFPQQPNQMSGHYVVKDPTSKGLSSQDKLANHNNETYKANNGMFPDRPFGSGGHTYSKGK